MKPTRILLSERASKALLEIGECFVVAGKSSHPDRGRIALHFIPCSLETANKAAKIALGETQPKTKP